MQNNFRNWYRILAVASLTFAGTVIVQQCRHVNTLKAKNTALTESNVQLHNERQRAYVYADSLAQNVRVQRAEIALVVANMPPAARSHLNRKLLAELRLD